MRWLDRLERRFGRWSIPNLMNLVIIGQVLVWFITMFVNYHIYDLLTLTRDGLAHLQLWRLVSFVFSPSLTMNPLFFALEVYLVYWIGTSLERAWGAFTFDVYFLLGMAGAWVACLLTGWGSSEALFYSLFFAFAWLFPDMQLMLFFVLPAKVKWLGWLAGGLYVLELASLLVTFQFAQALAQVLGLANFLVFFGPDFLRRVKSGAETRRRRREWQNQWRGR